jgi:hypothetical protein
VQLAAAFAPASLLAGSFARDKEIAGKIRVVLVIAIPASELAGEKAAASCTHSKASLRSHRLVLAQLESAGLPRKESKWSTDLSGELPSSVEKGIKGGGFRGQ